MRSCAVGEYYGGLEVIQDLGKDVYRCLCGCGKTRSALGRNLREGVTKSCGCYAKRKRSEGMIARHAEIRRKHPGLFHTIPAYYGVEVDDALDALDH